MMDNAVRLSPFMYKVDSLGLITSSKQIDQTCPYSEFQIFLQLINSLQFIV